MVYRVLCDASANSRVYRDYLRIAVRSSGFFSDDLMTNRFVCASASRALQSVALKVAPTRINREHILRVTNV